MQIVSNGDNLHETSDPVFFGKNKKNVISLSSAEYVWRMVKVMPNILLLLCDTAQLQIQYFGCKILYSFFLSQ